MGKRANLADVQSSAVVPAHGYGIVPYLTGAESVMASRLDDSFAFNAKEDGEVIKVTDTFISVKYKSGKKDGSLLGIHHGDMSGKAISHTYKTDLAEGAKFKKGTVLSWNDSYFERDIFSKANVIYKSACNLRVALLESNDTLEDSSALDDTAARLLTTTRSKTRAIAVKFDRKLIDLKRVGDRVEFNEALFTEVDASLTDNGDELESLKRFDRVSPKAKVTGTITSMRVLYKGNLEDMTPSLRELCEAENKYRKSVSRGTGKRIAETAEVSTKVFFGGEEVDDDTVVIKYQIDFDSDVSAGDKLVVCNQLKSIPGRRMVGVNESEDGQPVNFIFGYRSLNDRIVSSPFKVGYLSTTSMHVMKMFVEAYEK